MEHAPALHGVVDQSVSIDRARLLIERVPVALLGGATAAVGTAFVLQADMPAIGLWSWVAAVVVVHLVRLVLSRKASAPGILEAAPLRWLTRMRVSVFAAGAVWAAIPLWLYPTGTNEQWFIALVLSAVAGAGMTGLAVDAASAMLFILPIGVPIIARLLLSGNPPLHMVGMLAAVYLVYLLFAAWQMQKLFRDLTVLRTRATHQVLVDHLTGLPNRIGLNIELERALAHAQRTGDVVAVGYIDLDDFKQVNDRHGHAAGDALLQELARRWRQELRAAERIARLGGDEFVIVIEDLNPDALEAQIQAVATRIHRAVETTFSVTGAAVAQVGMTMGVACYPAGGVDADMLLR
jgi:diguanylate cyclase (GGDEF)-like protein